MTEETEIDDIKTGKTLSPAEWAEIVEIVELGSFKSYEEIARKYGITAAGISKGLHKRGVTKGSRAHEVAARVRSTVLKEAEESTLSALELRRMRIEETRRQNYDWQKMISAQIMGRLVSAQKEGRPFGSEAANIKALRWASAALATARQERFAVLDAENEIDTNELPELRIRDLSEEEIAVLRTTDGDDGEMELSPEIEDVVSEE